MRHRRGPCKDVRRADTSSFGTPLPEALAAGGPVEKVVLSLRFPRIILVGVVAELALR